jgi:hypothetical protein
VTKQALNDSQFLIHIQLFPLVPSLAEETEAIEPIHGGCNRAVKE